MKYKTFLVDNRAATAIEYGLIVALIALGMMVGLQALAGGTSGMWSYISDEVTEATKAKD